MIRKIFANLFVAFIVFPLLMRMKYWIDNNINPVLKYHSLKETLSHEFFQNSLYFIISFGFLILILLPYQVIKDHQLKRGKKLSLINKILLCSALFFGLILLFGSFSNIWWVPWYKNLMYPVFSLLIGVCFATLFYFLVDRYEECTPE